MDYDVVFSNAAQQIRVRVGPGGVEVVQPADAKDEDAVSFLRRNEAWILAQIKRVDGLRAVRRSARRQSGEILYRGEPTPVRIEFIDSRARGNRVSWSEGEIVVRRGPQVRTPAPLGLENWLRRQARSAIADYLSVVTARIGQRPGRVYVMDQRTKWGNCSSCRNLSFNWRLILAPDFVLRYLVTHEAVHLAVPDHSAKFWLTVESICHEAERAKQWLSRHHAQLTVDLASVVAAASACPLGGQSAKVIPSVRERSAVAPSFQDTVPDAGGRTRGSTASPD